MTPEFRPISVTIVDLLGVLLPGVIWLILLITLGYLIHAWFNPALYHDDITPLTVVLSISDDKSTAFYAILLSLSFIIGYSLKFTVLYVAERLCAFFVYLLRGGKGRAADYLFPYTKDHEDKDFYKFIVQYINTRMVLNENRKVSGDSDDQLISLPGSRTQPFSICKRILKVLNPALWEETESREATVRLLGSILLSAVLSFLIAVFSVFINSRLTTMIWLVESLIAVLFLSFAYRRARKSEVVYTFMNFLVAVRFDADSK